MFKYPNTPDGPECVACQSSLDDTDSASFVSVEDERLRSMHKPLIVFFLYSGDNSIPDKICLDCFDKFKGISEFYNQCKDSQSKYTPCFRRSTPNGGPSEAALLSTPRILSTETPDLSSSDSNRRLISSELLSSTSRSVPTQTTNTHQATQSNTPKEKKKYTIHHDLGIRLPKPIKKSRGCFDADDYCYLMLQDEFDRENAIDAAKEGNESRVDIGQKKTKFPPISLRHDAPMKIGQGGHTHFAQCPFCPALIQKKHAGF